MVLCFASGGFEGYISSTLSHLKDCIKESHNTQIHIGSFAYANFSICITRHLSGRSKNKT
jgi:hypothetical protein